MTVTVRRVEVSLRDHTQVWIDDGREARCISPSRGDVVFPTTVFEELLDGWRTVRKAAKRPTITENLLDVACCPTCGRAVDEGAIHSASAA